MDSKQKQRAVTEFLTKEGCRLSDIHRRLQIVYGDDTIDRSNVHRWMQKFKDGETSSEDKPRSGRPSTATTDTNRQRKNTSHTPWACYTTWLWSQCCDEVGTTVHTWFSSKRIQELGSMMAQMHRLCWKLCWVVPLYGGSVTLPTCAIWTIYI
jgi:transposase